MPKFARTTGSDPVDASDQAAIQTHCLEFLAKAQDPQTLAVDNLKTLQLAHGACQAAANQQLTINIKKVSLTC